MPNIIDPNANTPKRVTRNFQRLAEMLNGNSFVGTVSSVAMTVPSIMSVSGSPITTSGTLAVTLATQTANLIFAGPASGGAAIPTFRTMVVADIPNDLITYAKIQNVSATDRLLGRQTAGAGDIEEITCTAAGRALIDDADNTAQRTTLGLGTFATKNVPGTTWTITNGTTDRAYDANATTLDEIADALYTLIADLQAAGVLA